MYGQKSPAPALFDRRRRAGGLESAAAARLPGKSAAQR